ncbi:unnamed protein product [Linum trigynum]|uniref:F-box domain-containing protein n=1 Tax=Linum trigynum TaxID=586398 RepID=A0AAV2C867_9ROSI
MATEGCPWSWASRKRRRIRKPPPNLAMIGKLGDDLLVEILIRLPNHRFASGCKPVCKRWRSLISSPRFNRRFISHHRINQPTMPDNPDDLQSIILSFLPPMPSAVAGCFKVLDCFKDLVLCGFWDLDSDNKELCRSYFICNPFTKQWMGLPLAPEKATGYKSHCTRFVFEPRISYDLDMEGGDDEQKIVYSEYRFRVVSMYQHDKSIKLDWFCSQSGKWTNEALVLRGKTKMNGQVISCNGELFWTYHETEDLCADRIIPWVAVFNPFRPDVPPTPIDTFSFFGLGPWNISESQGALYVIQYRSASERFVWRLEEDGKSWSKQYEGLLKKSGIGTIEHKYCILPFLHPHKPEIIFFHYYDRSSPRTILSFDSRTGELEEFTKVGEGASRLMVFHPMACCLPTPIPKYEELRSMYDGSYNFWVQSSSTATTPSITAEECEPVEGVGLCPQFRAGFSNPGSGLLLVDGFCNWALIFSPFLFIHHPEPT